MKIKKYKNGGKTSLTAKQKADIEAEKKRLAAAKRKNKRNASIARSAMKAESRLAKELGEKWDVDKSPAFKKYFSQRKAQEDSLIKNASPMHKELIADLNKATGRKTNSGLSDKDLNRKTIPTRPPEERYLAGMKVKKFKDGGMMEYASGGMLKALLEDPKQREMAKKMLSKEYEGGGMVEYGGGGYMEYDKGGYMSNEQMVMVKADTLEEATKAVKAAVKAGGMTPTHYKVKACFYEDED